jgi:ankyrin repeat protein
MDKKDTFPLHNAVMSCDAVLTLQLLQHQKADPNLLDDKGMGPLHWAVYGGYYEIAKILLENGANPNLRKSSGETALLHAEDDFGLTEIATLLRQFGATEK